MSFLLNDVNNHDNSFSLGWRRDYSQAAFTRATFSQVPSQEFAMGGVFKGVKPNLNSLYLELERFFARN